MDRRAFMGTVAGGLFAAPLAAKAQQAGKLVWIGLLDYAESDPAGTLNVRLSISPPEQ